MSELYLRYLRHQARLPGLVALAEGGVLFGIVFGLLAVVEGHSLTFAVGVVAVSGAGFVLLTAMLVAAFGRPEQKATVLSWKSRPDDPSVAVRTPRQRWEHLSDKALRRWVAAGTAGAGLAIASALLRRTWDGRVATSLLAAVASASIAVAAKSELARRERAK